jgi:hypothetical protein
MSHPIGTLRVLTKGSRDFLLLLPPSALDDGTQIPDSVPRPIAKAAQTRNARFGKNGHRSILVSDAFPLERIGERLTRRNLWNEMRDIKINSKVKASVEYFRVSVKVRALISSHLPLTQGLEIHCAKNGVN